MIYIFLHSFYHLIIHSLTMFIHKTRSFKKQTFIHRKTLTHRGRIVGLFDFFVYLFVLLCLYLCLGFSLHVCPSDSVNAYLKELNILNFELNVWASPYNVHVNVLKLNVIQQQLNIVIIYFPQNFRLQQYTFNQTYFRTWYIPFIAEQAASIFSWHISYGRSKSNNSFRVRYFYATIIINFFYQKR